MTKLGSVPLKPNDSTVVKNPSPWKIVVAMAATIFLTEFLVMMAFQIFPFISSWLTPIEHGLLDSTLLVLLLSPLLYLLIVRPILKLMNKLGSAEAELRNIKEHVMEVVGVMVVSLDKAGCVMFINRKGMEILGRSQEDIIGKNWFDAFIPEPSRTDARTIFDHLLTSSEELLEHYEIPVTCWGGAERLIRWRNKPLIENGQTTGLLYSGEDITDHVAALEALGQSETRYRLVHNTAFDAIIVANGDDMVVDCNPAAEKIFGFAPGTLKGTPLISLMPSEYRERHENARKRFLSTGVSSVQGKVLELQGLKKNGQVFPIELVLSSFSLARDVYFTGTIRDITEKRNAERDKEALQIRLSQSQKMEAIGRLASGIAHDFNNILTVIRGYSELASDETPPESPVQARLKEVLHSIALATNLTRQLLLFSRGQSAIITPIDINKAVMNILKMIERIIGEDVTVTTELEDGLWTVTGDEGSIEQVIMNMAVNAKDAMPDGGTLTIRTQNVTISGEEAASSLEAHPGDAVRITIADTGMGIDKDVLDRVFEPFFSTKGADKGTGLGLSVVYNIIKKHNGWVTVKSESGRGTQFMVYLPVAPLHAKGMEEDGVKAV